MRSEKKCAKCEKVKSVEEFGIDNASPDGRKYWCKSCVKEYNKKYWKGYERRPSKITTTGKD